MSSQCWNRFSLIAMIVCTAALRARAEVDLSWAPEPRTVAAGVVFEIGLYATASAGQSQTISAMDVVLSWDPASVVLLGVDNNGPYAWLQSGFPADSALDGLNNTFDDGDAKYTALSAFGNAAVATPSGLLVTTFRFTALTETTLSTIVIEPSIGNFSVTRVFGADFPNQNVTGTLSPAVYTVELPGDCDGDGDNDLFEFQRLQICFTGEVGPSDPPAYSTEPGLCCSVFDYDDDGDIDLANYEFYYNIVIAP